MELNKIKSYAKLNLAINIVGKTRNLHKIETIVAFASLHDEISIKSIKSNLHKIIFSGKFSNNIKKKNTISKLLEILEKEKILKNRKFKIKINKKIPTKSGLGGGSMNAASILKFFVQKKIVKLSKEKLLNITQSVGSDVILGLNPVNSVLTSKNRVKSFYNCKTIYLLIVKPNFGCSTKDIYFKVKKFDKIRFRHPRKNMFSLGYLKNLNNSLEHIALSKYPKLRTIKLFLENLSKPVFVRMTGSGSALVAYFESKEKCDKAKKIFKTKYKKYWCIASKTI